MGSIINYKSILGDVNKDNLLERLMMVESISIHKWKLNSPYADLVYANEEGVLVVKFDLHDLSSFGAEWLPDESTYMQDPPFYYSASGHRVSPVYKVCRAAHELEGEEGYQVYSLVISNCSIINHDEFISIWASYNTSLVHQVAFDMESLPPILTSESLPEGENGEDEALKKELVEYELYGRILEIKSWEDSEERWDKEIDNQEEEDSDTPEDDEDYDYDDEDDVSYPGELSIAYIQENLFRKSEWTCEIFQREDGSISTDTDRMALFQRFVRHFRYVEGCCLWVRFRWCSQFLPDKYKTGEKHVIIKVLDEFGSLLKEYSIQFKEVYERNECIKRLDLFDRKSEIFVVQVYIDDLFMISEEVVVFDFPAPFTSCFELESLKLYRWNPNYWITEFNQRQLGSPLCIFDKANLNTVVAQLLFRNKLGRVILTSVPIEVSLYGPDGEEMCVERANASWIEKDGEPYLEVYHRIDSYIKLNRTGYYRIGFKFMEETIGIVYFEVRNFDKEGEFDQAEVNRLTDLFLNHPEDVPFDKKETPMEELDKLIGLHQVKKQIKLYRETIAFVRKRREMGLSGEYPSLHALFLGNPGTGKTKVANLLGGILKELGMLSEGHVVYEERSTLLGVRYSDEETKTLDAIERAQGGILFIDEAYNLYKPDDPKDPGKNVLETLLTALSDEDKKDWMLLMAGYTEPMLAMMNCNPGLDSRIPPQNRYYFDDYTVDELMEIVDLYCRENNYQLTPEARQTLRIRVNRDYRMRDETFGNARHVLNLMKKDVLYAMSSRVNKLPNPTQEQLMTIEKEDIPQCKLQDYRKPLKKLQEIVGLSNLKKSVEGHLNMVQLNLARSEQGIPTEMPPLHMAFVGNPGTGKTMVADLMGEIYASMGLLSVGKVMKVERKDLVGQRVGETERKTTEVLRAARGHVLFIDEAYTLCNSSESNDDFGKRAIEVLLTTLSREQVDMIVIFAGYPQEMAEFFRLNPGLRSRIPYTFYFEDYSLDELMEIAREVVRKKHFYFSPAAFRMLRVLVEKQLQKKEASWGNARFITRLIASHIIPSMSNRLKHLPSSRLQDKKTLQMICKSDIPLTIEGLYQDTFDEAAICRSLKKLDSLVGLSQVKEAIHNFVDISRYMYQHGMPYSSGAPLRWTFTGNTGTGKSTVAGILAELLKAMSYLGSGQLVEVKAEEIHGIPEYKVDEVLRMAMKRAQNGLLFIDGDAPQFGRTDCQFNSDALRFKLSSMLADMPGAYAMVIGELAPRVQTLTDNMLKNGVPSFNRTLHFPDYTEKELSQILSELLKKRKLQMSVEACCHMNAYIHGLYSQSELGYANARTMKEIADSIAEQYMIRASREGEDKDKTITLEDVKPFVWRKIVERKGIGFK